MNKWKVEYLPAALQDRRRLDGSVRKTVDKAIDKVSTNPLPVDEGGYGKPLGNKSGNNLTGLLKIKLKASGIRIIYQIVRENTYEDRHYRYSGRRSCLPRGFQAFEKLR